MVDLVWQNIQAQLASWVAGLLTLAILRQAAAFLLIFLLALLLRWPLRLLLRSIQTRLARIAQFRASSWIAQLFTLILGVLRPLAAWVLGQVALKIFQSSQWESSLLAWAVPFFAIWLAFRGAKAFLALRMSPQQAQLWSRQILRPLTWLVVALHATRLLDDVLNSGLRLSKDVTLTLGTLLLGAVVFYVFFLLSRSARRFLGDTFLPRAGVEPALTQVLSSFLAYALILAGLLTSLEVAGIDLTALTFVVAGLTVGLGFGMQEIISNFVSGFILLFERSIGPGDVIQVGQATGMVEGIGIRSMRIKTLDNVELIVPNSRFLTDVVTNFTRGDARVRIHVAVGVSYSADPAQVEEALLAAAQHPMVLAEPPPRVHFSEFGASSLGFDLMVWMEEPMRISQLSSDLRYSIWSALAERKIEIPFPQRDIHIRSVDASWMSR